MQVLSWDRHKIDLRLNPLMGSSSLSDNLISISNTDIYKLIIMDRFSSIHILSQKLMTT